MRRTVDDYIERQPSPQKEICKKLRELVLATFPGIKEEMKMGVPWYEDLFYIVGLKNHVNLGFSIKALSEDEISLFQGSGKTMKHIEITSPDEIDDSRIVELLELVYRKSGSIR